MDRPLQLEWLDAAAGRLAAGDSPKQARDHLWKMLEGVVAGGTPYTARGKTLTVLGHVWLTPPESARALRDNAVKLVTQASADERLAMHWAMLSATYPFFVDVGGLIGKSLSLNGEFALAQLTRRLVDTWGDRSTLRPAVQRITRSMVQWRVLRESRVRGTFIPPAKRISVPTRFAELLIEGLLVSNGAGLPLAQVGGHPALFPFTIDADMAHIRRHARLRVSKHGDGADFLDCRSESGRLRPSSKKS
jgi:hypothetical protein